jgi:hypothetical protein
MSPKTGERDTEHHSTATAERGRETAHVVSCEPMGDHSNKSPLNGSSDSLSTTATVL